MAIEYKYEASPTGALFHAARLGTYKFKGIRGVPGSGKSVTCCWDIFLKSNMQVAQDVPDSMAVVDAYGTKYKRIRWSTWLIGRHTYPALRNTTIQTWKHWFPDTQIWVTPNLHGKLVMPSIHNDGTAVVIDLLFYAMESPTIKDDLLGLEISGAYINEACQVPWDVIQLAQTRVGRFQPFKNSDVKQLSFGVIMDTNTPSESNWWCKKEFEEKPDEMLWFAQPPGLLYRGKGFVGRISRKDFEPNDGRDFEKNGTRAAENIEHLEGGHEYYFKMLIGASWDMVKRQVLNLPGTSNDGLPIYPEFNDATHVYRGKEPWQLHRGLPLLLGMDFGCNPACVIAQMGSDGVLRVFDECVGFNMIVPQFVDEILKPKLINDFRFGQMRMVCFCDPAGMNKTEMSAISSIEYLNSIGITAVPSPDASNDFIYRRTCVSEKLRSHYKGMESLQISEKCKWLREGFNGWYCYRKIRGAEGEDRYTEQADKGKHSHIHDALQYLCVGLKSGGSDIAGGGMFGRSVDLSGYDMNFDGDYIE